MARIPPPLRRLVCEDGSLKLANLVTLSRALLIPPILALLWSEHGTLALGLYIAAACTDLIDGWLARRSHQASAFGAQLDAAVDNLFSIAIMIFLAVAFPGLVGQHLIAFWSLALAPVIYLAVSWILKRRLLMFHFWSAKVGAFLLFSLWPLIAVTGQAAWLVLAAVVISLSRLEQIALIIRGGLDVEAPHGFVSLTSPRKAAR